MKILLIDDARSPEYIEQVYGKRPTSYATTYWEGVSLLNQKGWDILFLDHDLSSYDENGKELTGTDIMKFLQENPDLLPKEVVFVTNNPVGRVRMQGILEDIKSELGV